MLIFITISEKVNNSLETSKNFLKNVGDTAINKSENITNSAVETFNNTNTVTKNVIQDNLNKVNNAKDLVSNTIQSLWNNWVANHWAIAFVVSHPIIGIVLLITVILTIWGLIQMIPSLLVNFWLLVFKSPFIFGKSLLKIKNEKEVTENFNSNQEKLLKQILTKLEMIEKEQKNIKEELKKHK
ncbi:hypothetical protein [Geminocystis sp.]|uniref:hypothetical protein n=1 Tax=Geminocystis sp. TaxID=2664100 RepID=UPI003593A1BB